MNVKKWMALGLTAALAVSLAACGQNSESAAQQTAAAAGSEDVQTEPVEITFYSYTLLNASAQEATQKLMDEFMAQNPDVKVTGVPVSNSDMAARLQADMAAGEVPDVAQLPFRAMDFAINGLGAVAINDLTTEEEFDKNFETFSPNGLALGEYDGKTYCLPFTFSTPVLFYNGTLFEQAGLDPNDPPETWDEVLQYGQAIKEANPDVEALHVATTGASSGEWIAHHHLQRRGRHGRHTDAARHGGCRRARNHDRGRGHRGVFQRQPGHVSAVQRSARQHEKSG